MLAYLREKEMKAISKRDAELRVAGQERQRLEGVRLRCEWIADTSGVTPAHIAKHHHEQRQEEIKMAAKALVMVRRAALQKLLRDEQQQYKEELRQLGKTFFVQRL
ncbi:cilia- and flagella-associated protein 141 [Discoglossus pictus]